MAIATTANLLLGLRWTKMGKKYTELMLKQAGMDKELCDAGTNFILISMLPFAVELCLKGLKAQGGNGFVWTHNLKSLWEDLNEEEQAEVRKRVGQSSVQEGGEEAKRSPWNHGKNEDS